MFGHLDVQICNIIGFKESAPFINWLNAPLLSQEELFAAYDTSMKKVAIELFRINGGKQRM